MGTLPLTSAFGVSLFCSSLQSCHLSTNVAFGSILWGSSMPSEAQWANLSFASSPETQKSLAKIYVFKTIAKYLLCVATMVLSLCKYISHSLEEPSSV